MPIHTVSSSEVQARLPELLRQVQAGQEFEVSVHGRAVARLSPIFSRPQQRSVAVAKMRRFMQAQQVLRVGIGLNVRELIEEGRR